MSFTSAKPEREHQRPHERPHERQHERERERPRWGDVYLAAGARGVSTCGDFLAATALALALQSAGAGGLAVSALMLAAVLPLVVLAPLTGRLADRVDSRTLLITAGAGQAVICFALAYADGTALIIALVALLACGLAVTQPTLAALLPEMVRRDDLPRATAVNQTAGSVGVLVGPALAGLLVGAFGAKIPLLIDGATYLALVAAGLLLRTRRNGGTTPRAAAVAWRLRRDPMVLAVTAAVAATLAGVGAVGVVEIFFVRETLGGSTVAFGLIQATWTAGMLAGAWLLARPAKNAADDGALVNGLVLMLGLCCAAVLAGAAVPAVWWLVPLWLAGGVLNGGLNVYLAMVMARRVPAEARGRAFAVQGAAIQGAGMFGYLAGGLLLEGVAPRPLIAACGLAGLLVVAVVAIPVARAVRGERKAPRAAWATSAASA